MIRVLTDDYYSYATQRSLRPRIDVFSWEFRVSYIGPLERGVRARAWREYFRLRWSGFRAGFRETFGG
jgi:hypothetical protein